MDVSSEKLEIIQRICEIQDTELLDLIKNIVDLPGSSATGWWDTLTEAEQISIQKGVDDLKTGRLYSHKQIRKKYEKWLED